MAIDLTPSLIYVDQNGTILEKARLLRILMGEPASPAAYEKLLASQNPDGGFPSRPRPGSASALDSTLTALWQLDELGLYSTPGTIPATLRALDFLLAQQRPDGGWDENPNLPPHDLPPWIRPGETATRLYLSSYSAYWLGVATREISERHSSALMRGAAFLASWQGRNTSSLPASPLTEVSLSSPLSGQMPGYQHNNWLSISAFLLAGRGYAQNAERGLAYLASRPFDGETASPWEDSQIGWAIDCLARAGLPAQHPFLQEALEALRQRRAPDGSWASEDGPAFAASATVGAIKVLTQLGGEQVPL